MTRKHATDDYHDNDPFMRIIFCQNIRLLKMPTTLCSTIPTHFVSHRCSNCNGKLTLVRNTPLNENNNIIIKIHCNDLNFIEPSTIENY